jgi:hypothetical protein
MFRLFFLYALLIIFSASCKSHKNSATKSNAPSKILHTKDTATVAKTSVQRFIVSFYSIGSGAEGKQMEKLKVFISEFEKQINKKISFGIAPWGREGEVDYCLPLKELSEDQQKQFISGAKDALQMAQWVHYSENVPCRK